MSTSSKFLMLALCFVGALASLQKGLDNDQILRLIDLACPPEKYMCPKKEFGRFYSMGWLWNEAAIFGSSAAESMRNGKVSARHALPFLRNEFCCTEGACLQLCGIWPVNEIDLIKNFPHNVQEIFGLDIEDLESVRTPVLNWIQEAKNRKISKPYPAEVEEYFDILHENEQKIKSQLKSQKETPKASPSFH